MDIKKETLQIEGMSCNHCVASVKNALQSEAGVEVGSVEIGKAEVSYNPNQITHAQLVTAIEDIGFEVVENAN